MNNQNHKDIKSKTEDKLNEETENKTVNNKQGIIKLDKKEIKNILAIVSGKGGVGKSFISAIIAIELRKLGNKVGILDADITGPSIAKMFGLNKKPTVDEKGILPVITKTGIQIISINLILDKPEQATIWRGPIINNVIRQLYSDVNWENLDFLIVDLPPGTSDAPLTVYQSLPLDGVIVVTTPQKLALMIVAKSINMAKAMNIPILGLIENMSYIKCSDCGKKTDIFGKLKNDSILKEIGISLIGTLELDPNISELSDTGRIEEYSNPIISKLVKKLSI